MKNSERVAFSCILGVLGGLVFTNTGADGGELFLFWIVYTVTCGVVINTAKGIPSTQLVASSWQSPLVLTLAMLFRVFFQGASTVSGMPFTGSLLDYLRIAIICVASFIGIWLFSHARPMVLRFLRYVFRMREDRAKMVETRLNWIVRVLGIVLLISQLVLG